MIQRKDGEISLPGLKRHTGELFPFFLSYDKPCGKLAVGQNCYKIISYKSNSVAMFLRIQTDRYELEIKCCDLCLITVTVNLRITARGAYFKMRGRRRGAYLIFPKSWPVMNIFLIHYLRINTNRTCLLT